MKADKRIPSHVFFEEETWRGGYYELAMEYPSGSNHVLESALRAIWACPGIAPYSVNENGLVETPIRLSRPSITVEVGRRLRGMAILPNGKVTACGTFLVREDRSDCVGFFVPLGA